MTDIPTILNNLGFPGAIAGLIGAIFILLKHFYDNFEKFGNIRRISAKNRLDLLSDLEISISENKSNLLIEQIYKSIFLYDATHDEILYLLQFKNPSRAIQYHKIGNSQLNFDHNEIKNFHGFSFKKDVSDTPFRIIKFLSQLLFLVFSLSLAVLISYSLLSQNSSSTFQQILSFVCVCIYSWYTFYLWKGIRSIPCAVELIKLQKCALNRQKETEPKP